MVQKSKELPYLKEWLIDWKRKTGCKIIAINNGKELNDYRIQKFQLKNVFDAFVSSCEVGIRKPQALGIFH